MLDQFGSLKYENFVGTVLGCIVVIFSQQLVNAFTSLFATLVAHLQYIAYAAETETYNTAFLY